MFITLLQQKTAYLRSEATLQMVVITLPIIIGLAAFGIGYDFDLLCRFLEQFAIPIIIFWVILKLFNRRSLEDYFYLGVFIGLVAGTLLALALYIAQVYALALHPAVGNDEYAVAMLNFYIQNKYFLGLALIFCLGVMLYLAKEQRQLLRHKGFYLIVILLSLSTVTLLLGSDLLAFIVAIKKGLVIFYYLPNVFRAALYMSVTFIVGISFYLFRLYRGNNKHKQNFLKATRLIALYFCLLAILPVLLVFSLFVNKLSWEAGSDAFKAFMSNNLAANFSIALMIIVCIIYLATIHDQIIKAKNKSDTYGDADFAKDDDLIEYDFLANDNEDKILSGQTFSGKNIYLPVTNRTVIAPTGGMKTVSVIIPALLTYQDATFTWDPKGELFFVTAAYRSLRLGRKILYFDPYDLVKPYLHLLPKSLHTKAALNIFDYIPEDEKARDRMLDDLAIALTKPVEGHVSAASQHFQEITKLTIAGLIDYVSLSTLPKSLSSLSEAFNIFLEDPEQVKGIDSYKTQLTANLLAEMRGDEKSGLISTVTRSIEFTGSVNFKESLTETSFDIQEFLSGHADIYIILPPDQAKDKSQFFRLILATLLALMVKHHNEINKRYLFLFDELPQLGYMPDVEKGIEILRSYGGTFWASFQSMKQIKTYPKHDLFTSMNSLQFFGNNDVETLEYVKRLGGSTTKKVTNSSDTKGSTKNSYQFLNHNYQRSKSHNTSEVEAALIPVNKIRELPDDEQIIFIKGKKPIHCRKLAYFEAQEFQGKFGRNLLEERR